MLGIMPFKIETTKSRNTAMKERNFRQLLEAQWARGNFVCTGLDSELGKIPAQYIKKQPKTAAVPS